MPVVRACSAPRARSGGRCARRRSTGTTTTPTEFEPESRRRRSLSAHSSGSPPTARSSIQEAGMFFARCSTHPPRGVRRARRGSRRPPRGEQRVCDDPVRVGPATAPRPSVIRSLAQRTDAALDRVIRGPWPSGDTADFPLRPGTPHAKPRLPNTNSSYRQHGCTRPLREELLELRCGERLLVLLEAGHLEHLEIVDRRSTGPVERRVDAGDVVAHDRGMCPGHRVVAGPDPFLVRAPFTLITPAEISTSSGRPPATRRRSGAASRAAARWPAGSRHLPAAPRGCRPCRTRCTGRSRCRR